MRQITSGRVLSAQKMVKVAETDLKINISVSTIKRILKYEGLVSFKRPKKPLLSRAHRQKRKEFALKHLYWTVDDWKWVIWSDEVKINRIGSDGIKWGWRRPGEQLRDHHVIKTVKFGGGHLLLWGCLTYYGIGFARMIEGTLDSEMYIGTNNGTFTIYRKIM